jgi:hypothetical protein
VPTPKLSDEKCREALELWTQYGEYSAAARSLGLSDNAFTNRVNQARARGMDAGDGYRVKGTSTLYDAQTGEAKLQWVKTDTDKERQQSLFKEAIAALAKNLPRVVIRPPKPTTDALMAIYPVGDHHLGMLAWDKETGTDYDLEISENLLIAATNYLVKATPNCDECAVIFLGDFMHYDGMEPVTPEHKNQLDADSRFPKMVQVAIRTMRYLIEAAAKKHLRVRVIVEIGNHDIASSIFLMQVFANIYENDDRISVDTSPMLFHYIRFGKNLIGVHHGHKAKADKLPLIMAADRSQDWGQTSFRYWYTGHIHHDTTKDYTGCRVESFRVLAAPDAWTSQMGYRQKRDMKAIVLHKEFGEVARHTVNPEMLNG